MANLFFFLFIYYIIFHLLLNACVNNVYLTLNTMLANNLWQTEKGEALIQ